MEKKIVEYFGSETMPEDCVHRIEATLTEAKPKRARPVLRAVAAAAAMLLMILAVGNAETLKVYAEEIYEQIIHALDLQEQDFIGQVENNVFISYGGVVVSYRDDVNLTSIKINETIPAEVRDGKLYFIANGENIDITDLCSIDTAFIYVVEDATGIQHYIIVGGTPDNWGYQIIMKDPSAADGDPNGWIGGGSSNHCGESSNWEPYGWVYDAKEKIGHPWPI